MKLCAVLRRYIRMMCLNREGHYKEWLLALLIDPIQRGTIHLLVGHAPGVHERPRQLLLRVNELRLAIAAEELVPVFPAPIAAVQIAAPVSVPRQLFVDQRNRDVR